MGPEPAIGTDLLIRRAMCRMEVTETQLATITAGMKPMFN
jgi:hypothetical protein